MTLGNQFSRKRLRQGKLLSSPKTTMQIFTKWIGTLTKISNKFRAFISAEVPIGYEDATGFHREAGNAPHIQVLPNPCFTTNDVTFPPGY